MWHVLERRETYRDFWLENLKEKGRFEDLGIDGKMLLKCIFKIGWEVVDWIQDKNRFRGVVNTPIKPLGSVKCGEFFD